MGKSKFTPSEIHLERYADLMVNACLGNGQGIKKGDVVALLANEITKPLFWKIYEAVIKAGGNVLPVYMPNECQTFGDNRVLFEHGSHEQLSFALDKYWTGLVDQIDHFLFIVSYSSMDLFEGIDSKKVLMHARSRNTLHTLKKQKEQKGDLSWTICLYPTEAIAKEAGVGLQEYWNEIVQACNLDDENPIAKWNKIREEISFVKKTLTDMQIKSLHIEGEDIDLEISVGVRRQWLGGSGRNMPSYEVFISPDWRGADGWVRFNQPLYYSGKKITGVELVFENGIVSRSSASTNKSVLQDMIAEENANKIGEFSLTDRRHSPISRFMACTLYDENRGGSQGNTHIALGNAYRDSLDGDISEANESLFEHLGFNKSKVHTDIVSTSKRKVTATLSDNTEKVIYDNGQFTFLN